MSELPPSPGAAGQPLSHLPWWEGDAAGHAIQCGLRTPAFNMGIVAMLQRSLAANADNVQTWMRLGHAQRRLGNFEAARDAYAQVLAREPENGAAAWLLAITAGQPLPAAAPADGALPTPFLHLRNFLAPAESARLRQWAEASRSLFRPARLMTGEGVQMLPRQHRAFNLHSDGQTTEAAWLIPKVRAILPRVTAALGIDIAPEGADWIKLAVQPNEGFSWPHRDPFELVVVCYIHQEPRPFSGGDLLLHDSEPDTKAEDVRAFSRVKPIGNSAVFYPGPAFHEITPVACSSDDLLSARLTAMVSLPMQANGAAARQRD